MHTRRRLSVVIVCTGDTLSGTVDCAGLEATLAALEAQINPPDMEIIVPCHTRMTRIDEVRRRFPHVRFLDASGQHVSAGRSRAHHDRLRACGAAAAQGEIVAFIEDHIRPDPHWAAQVIAAHRQPYAGIGGPVDNAVDRALSWAAYFVDLGRYQSPLRAGASRIASLVNASYKRAALDEIRPVWCDRFNETLVNAAIIGSGQQIVLDPRPVVFQHREHLNLQVALVEFLVWGRSYAATRSAHMPYQFRLLYAWAAPLLVTVLWLRQARVVLDRRRHRAAFVRAAPYCVLLTTSWVFGEWLGYVTGRA
jgi:hypothetical protein